MDYLTHLRHDSARFAEVLANTAPTDPVPSCPGWTASDLLWHLSEVQHFWGSIVAGRLTDRAAVQELERPGDHPGLLAQFRQSSARLAEALAAAADDVPVWTWSSDQSVGFVRRRQAHEALIHRVDAELTAGQSSAVDPNLAADGVAELVELFIGGVPTWATFAPDGTTLRLELNDRSRSWGLALGRMAGTSPNTGTTYDLDAAMAEPVTTDNVIRAAAGDLDLWLWGRGGESYLDVSGDPGMVVRLRTLAAEATQ